MKIIQINNYAYNRGGAETVFFNTINLLKSKGHQVISIGKFNGKSQKEVDYLVSENQFFFNRFYSLNAKKIIREILEKEKPDIVHIHNIIGGISFSILPVIKKFNIPIVASIHDFRLLCPVGIFINGKKQICEKCKGGKYYKGIINKCNPGGYIKSSVVVVESYLRDFLFPHSNYLDAYIFVSQFTKQKFLEFYPQIKDRAFVLYNFTQNFAFEKKRGDYFLYFGRLDREKGILTLLKAFAELKNLKLIILGSGPFEKYIKDFNLNSNIIYLGFKSGNELVDLIKNSEYVIIPSECYENLPMSAVESLSFGKPIITTGMGGLKELINNNLNGFQYSNGNYKALMNVIEKAHDISDEDYFKLSEDCYYFATSNFHANFYYDKLISLYQKLVEMKR